MTAFEMVCLIAALAIAVAGALYVSLYNGAQRYLNMVPEIESNVGVLRLKRQDLINRLKSIVDSYNLHESSIATQVSDRLGGETVESGASLTARLTTLRMAFPELKADALYGNLMEQLAIVEGELSSRREQYNAVVRAYNTLISEFPGNVLLKPYEFKLKPFWVESDISDYPVISQNQT